MPTNVIMPALELAQETGKVLRWLKRPGDTVAKGDPIVEIETDKVTVEIEAPAAGVLREVSAGEGDVVAVGTTIARIFSASEAGVIVTAPASAQATGAVPAAATPSLASAASSAVKASPLARKLAEQHGVDVARIKTASGRVEKADVLAYVETQKAGARPAAAAAARAVESSIPRSRLNSSTALAASAA